MFEMSETKWYSLQEALHYLSMSSCAVDVTYIIHVLARQRLSQR